MQSKPKRDLQIHDLEYIASIAEAITLGLSQIGVLEELVDLPEWVKTDLAELSDLSSNMAMNSKSYAQELLTGTVISSTMIEDEFTEKQVSYEYGDIAEDVQVTTETYVDNKVRNLIEERTQWIHEMHSEQYDKLMEEYDEDEEDD